MFQSPFGCEITNRMEVNCKFGDYVKPAERLSGGQKIILAMAFRFAVNDMFAAKLGVLILDEPTAWLDDDNIDRIVDVLKIAGAHAKASNMQLLVITHEKELENIFDQTIKLARPAI